MRRITEKLCGVEISKDQACPCKGVSRMAQSPDEELFGYQQRILEKGYLYLVVDARYEYIREACTEQSECDGRVESEGVLTVKGIQPVWLKHHSVPRKWPEVETSAPVINSLEQLIPLLDRICHSFS